MNIREQLKHDIKMLPVGSRIVFLVIYGNKASIDADIDSIVDNLSGDRLQWAARQVANALRNLKKNHVKISIPDD